MSMENIEDWNDDFTYDELFIQDLIDFLEELGVKNNEIVNKYTYSDYHKHIFHYSLIKKYDINNIFLTLRNDYLLYNRFNNIVINNDTNVKNTALLIVDLFSKINGICCIFIDLQHKINFKRYHTTLLIYRKNIGKIEHFDPNGIARYGNIDKLNEIIAYILNKIPFTTFTNSKKLCGLESYDDKQAYSRGINIISNIRRKLVPGRCQIITVLIYELIYKYYYLSTEAIISNIYDKLKGLSFREAGIKVNNILNGFYIILLNRLNLYLNPLGIHSINQIMNEYNPRYVIQDMILNDIINEEIIPRVIVEYI